MATEERKCFCTAILLAGGSGKRMGSDVPKQFLKVAGKPLIWYSLHALEKSGIVDECILVVPKKDIPYVREEILSKGEFTKVQAVTQGGRERYESVWKGLQLLEKRRGCGADNLSQVIVIHDGARPFLTEEILERCYAGAVTYGACVAAVPSKDTVTISDEEGFEMVTPNRKYVWNVQTPQVFRSEVLFPAFRKMAQELERPQGLEELSWITDDASVVQHYSGTKIRLVLGDYRNIKVTTTEDLQIAERFLGHEASGVR